MVTDISLISDNQAEAGVIATLMYHPEYILHTEYLKAGYFYNVENGCIYWAISELYKNGIDTIDAINLTSMLNSNKAVKKKIEEYNISNIQEFINLSQYAARHSLEEYKLLVKNVVTMSFKRDLNKVAMEIQSQCFNSDVDLNKLNVLVNDKVSKVTEQYLVSNEISSFGSQVDDMWDEICSRRNEDGLYGLPSKFPLINEYCSYEQGEVLAISARMKRGKSCWMMNEAIHKIMNNVPTVYFDTEMSDRLFFERMLANISGVKVKQIKTGRYSEEEARKLRKAMDLIKKAPFVHMYIPQHTDEEIYSICKILKYKINLQFVVYDYIKSDLISSSEQYNALGQRTNFLKNTIAGELGLPVLTGMQLNRNNDVADSDKILRFVSTSIVWREKTSEEIAKDGGLEYGNFCASININRNGQQMEEDEYISFNFDGDRMRIVQAKQPPKHNDNMPFD